MAELTTQERLQPSLLDRLTDDAPHRREESRDERVISSARLRECVMRDLTWLLNTVYLEAVQSLAGHPQVQRSVVNYGIPDLTGSALSGLRLEWLQQRLREAIIVFEPRLIPETLRVVAQVDPNPARMDRRALVFIIESEMWAQPLPLALYLKTSLDLETGRIDILGNEG